MTRSRLVAALALTLAALTVPGCGDQPDDPADPTGEPSTTVEPTPEPTSEEPTESSPTGAPPEVEPPEAPPEMEIDDVDGAAATTWYFLQTYDYMRASGDTTRWEAITTDDCGWCTTVLDETNLLHEAGGWIESSGLDFEITTARVRLPEGDTPYYVVLVNVTEPPFTIVNGDGSAHQGISRTLEPMGVAVQYMDGRFRVVRVDYEVA